MEQIRKYIGDVCKLRKVRTPENAPTAAPAGFIKEPVSILGSVYVRTQKD